MSIGFRSNKNKCSPSRSNKNKCSPSTKKALFSFPEKRGAGFHPVPRESEPPLSKKEILAGALLISIPFILGFAVGYLIGSPS